MRTGPLLAVLLAAWCVAACGDFPSDIPPRPANVPKDAVQLFGSKTCWYVKCAYGGNANSCQVFNAGGVLIEDGAYRPYDGGRPVAESELQIDAKESMIDVLRLKNGRILILARAFDTHKRALDNERAGRR
jgi:hypothetical protein